MRDDRPRLITLLGVGAALLVLLALVAAATRDRNPFSHPTGGSGPSTTFVSYAWTTGLTVGVLLLLALIVFVVSGPKLGVRQRPPRRRDWWLILMALLSVALFSRIHHRPLLPPASDAGARQQDPRAGRLEPGRPQERATFRWDAFAAIVGAAAVVAALAVAARRRQAPLGEVMEEPEAETALALSDALEDSLEDLRREPDLRAAVIAAYARMERVLAAHGLARARWETPLEYMARALTGLAGGGSGHAVTRLTALFEQAKFSGHSLAPAMRDEAIDALVTLRDDLRRAAATPPPVPA